MSASLPVVELFGPTIQGEGPAQGERCYFLRLGGCDYRCSWCDTMYAVEPAEVRKAPRMTPTEAVRGLLSLGMDEGDLLILSGGNPALQRLDGVLDELERVGVRTHIETQGTVYRPWLERLELVVCSPKPPSAIGEQGAAAGIEKAAAFLAQLSTPFVLKFVAADSRDLDWAVGCLETLEEDSGWAMHAYLSACTPQNGDLVAGAVESYRWLANQAVERDDLARFRVGLQQHVLAWPGERNR